MQMDHSLHGAESARRTRTRQVCLQLQELSRLGPWTHNQVVCSALSMVRDSTAPAAKSGKRAKPIQDGSTNVPLVDVEATLNAEETTCLRQYVQAHMSDWTNHKKLHTYQQAWEHVKDLDGNFSLNAMILAIVSLVDTSLNPRWVQVVHAEAADESNKSMDYFPDVERAVQFLQLRARVLLTI